MSGFNLSALAVRERSVTLFVIILISIAGVLAFFQLGRAEDPAFTVKTLTVVTAWPGATAQEMQDQVAERLEKRLQELRWYDRTETFARPGLAITLVQLRDDMPPSQVQDEFYQARKKLGDEARTLGYLRHANVQSLPAPAWPRHSAQVAGGGCRHRFLRRCRGWHGLRAQAVLPDLRPS